MRGFASVATAIIGLTVCPATVLHGQDAGAADPPAASGLVIVSQAADGGVLLSGSVATIHGTMLRWEPQEKKRTLGFWTKSEDSAEWRFDVHTAAAFDLEVLQGCGTGQGGSEMIVTIDAGSADAAKLSFVVEDTGGFQAFKARTIGRVQLSAGEHTLNVKPERIAKQAACDIRQIRLVPAN